MRRISGGPVFARYAVFRRTSALNFPHSCRSLIAISFFLTLCRLTNANSSTTWLVGQSLEPGVGIAKDAFERVKRMLHPGPDAGLGDFLCSEPVLLLAFGHLLESAAFDGDVPTPALFAIELVSPRVACVGVDGLLSAGQQNSLMRLCHSEGYGEKLAW